MKTVLACVLAIGAAGAAQGQVDYAYDDGRGNALGPAFDEWDMVFLNAFEAQPGGERITSVSICWGSAVAGIPSQILVMDDPDGDGSPAQARVRATLAAETSPAGNGVFQTYELESPVRVCGWFFVGARVMRTASGRNVNPARIDPEAALHANMSYLVIGSNTSPEYLLSMENLGAAPVFYRMDNHAFRGTWLARAHGEPAPACVPDFNEDGFVDFFDYDDYVLCFESGACPPCRTADVNGDGFEDFFDYDDFVRAFEAGC